MAGIAKLEILEAAHAVAALDLSSAAVTIPADLYIAHYVAALPAAARAARTFGGIYAFDAEDFHLGDLPDSSEHALEKRIIYEIESRYLPGAIYVTAASPKIADAYAEAYNVERPTVVLNVFPRVSSQQSSKTHGRMVPGPSIYWFSQTIGPGRGLETAIKAIAQAKSGPHLYLRGRPAKGYDQRLRLLAQSAGVEGHLHFLELAAPSDMERLGAEFDIGYTGETAFSRNNAFALGNKLFSYLQSGIPIVASNTPAHTDLAPDLGCAMGLFPIEDAGALACVIDYFLLDSNKLAVARSRAWQLGHQRYCWDVEQQVFLAVVERALARRFTVV